MDAVLQLTRDACAMLDGVARFLRNHLQLPPIRSNPSWREMWRILIQPCLEGNARITQQMVLPAPSAHLQETKVEHVDNIRRNMVSDCRSFTMGAVKEASPV